VDVIVNEVIPERCRVSAAQITVLDEGWRGRTGLAFVDDPQKINVDVSRAAHAHKDQVSSV
jgi:hypothetical protein